MPNKRRPQRRSVPAYRPEEPLATNPQLAAAIREIIDTQIAQNNPPETRQTLERLVANGHTREGAYGLIATAVVGEIVSVMQSGQPYNAARYLAALQRIESSE
jgi:hypothetical protein